MSRLSDAKKARRRKRQAARDSGWVPREVVEQLTALQDSGQLAVVADLAEFDERITERGWTFDEDEFGDEYAWCYEPSGAEVTDGIEVTARWRDAAEDGEIVHLTFVGTVDHHEFTRDELFEHLDAIEAFRAGDRLPVFG